MKTARILAACATLLTVSLVSVASASTTTTFVTPTPPDGQDYSGVPYKQTVSIAGADSATILNHCGAWSWEENPTNAGDPAFGWTHTSNWTEIQLTEPAYLTVKMAASANVPWPSLQNPSRKAATNAMFPCFSVYKGWDVDSAPDGTLDVYMQYNGRANVLWAEDLTYVGHVENSTEAMVQHTYALLPGKYTIVQGSNAVTNDNANRQGYQLDLTTAAYYPPSVGDDSYYTLNSAKPLKVAVAAGLRANDANVATGYTLQVTKQPAKGTVVVSPDGSFTYTPGAYYGEAGFDTFAYQMVPTNGSDTIGPATVSITTLSAAAGQYTGLLLGAEDTGTMGLVKLLLTSTGKYTGTAWIQGTRYSLSGLLDGSGNMDVKAKPSLSGVEFSLATRDNGARHITAHLPAGDLQLSGEIEQSPFSRYETAPMAGSHKVVMMPKLPAKPDPALPTADGTATLKIGKSGAATLVGKLGDKTPFSVDSGLIIGTEAGPTFPVYAPLYKKGAGSLTGKLVFGATAEADAEGILQAVKPDPGFTLAYDTSTVSATQAKAKRKWIYGAGMTMGGSPAEPGAVMLVRVKGRPLIAGEDRRRQAPVFRYFGWVETAASCESEQVAPASAHGTL